MIAEGFELTISRDGIATVRMCNGDNRFQMSFIDGWNNVLNQVESNPDVKALIITGTGMFFSSGFDVTMLETQPKEKFELTVLTSVLLRRITLLPLPTVAAINGHAYGAGAFISIACDYRAMRSDRGWMCFPEVLLDTELNEFCCELLRTKIGTDSHTRDLAICGRKMTAQEALNYQLIDEAVSSERLEYAAIGLINSALGKNGISRHALLQAKQDLYASLLPTNIPLSKL